MTKKREDLMQCKGTTKLGKQCSRSVLEPGATYCHLHDPDRVRSPRQYTYKFDSAAPRLLEAVKKGNSQGVAAVKSGVDPETVSIWKRKGKQAIMNGEPENKYAVFLRALEGAHFTAVGKQEDNLFRAGNAGSVPAMTKWLEAHYPELYGKKQQLTVDEVVRVDYSQLPTDQIRGMINAALEKAGQLADKLPGQGNSGDTGGR